MQKRGQVGSSSAAVNATDECSAIRFVLEPSGVYASRRPEAAVAAGGSIQSVNGDASQKPRIVTCRTENTGPFD